MALTKLTRFCILFLLPPALSLAQETDTTSVSQLFSRLAPLDSVIVAALKFSPMLRLQDAVIKKNEYMVKRAKMSWTETINLQLGNQVGSYGNSTLNEINVGYQASLNLKLSIFELFGRSNKINIQKQEWLTSIHRKDDFELELRKNVIAQYNHLALTQRIIQIKNSAFQVTGIQKQMAERDFIAGEITVSELARVTEISANAESEFEIARMELQNAYAQLETLIGIKLSEIRMERQ